MEECHVLLAMRFASFAASSPAARAWTRTAARRRRWRRERRTSYPSRSRRSRTPDFRARQDETTGTSRRAAAATAVRAACETDTLVPGVVPIVSNAVSNAADRRPPPSPPTRPAPPPPLAGHPRARGARLARPRRVRHLPGQRMFPLRRGGVRACRRRVSPRRRVGMGPRRTRNFTLHVVPGAFWPTSLRAVSRARVTRVREARRRVARVGRGSGCAVAETVDVRDVGPRRGGRRG